VRRVLIALVSAAAAVLTLAAPASAAPEEQIVIGYGDGSFEVERVPAGTVGSAIARAERDPEVAYAEPDVTFRVAEALTPNDPMWPEQWGSQLVKAPEVW
jgi:hypothetical protein